MSLFKKAIKFITLVLIYNGIIWILIDGVHRVKFFDNFLKNTFVLIFTLAIYELIDFIGKSGIKKVD